MLATLSVPATSTQPGRPSRRSVVESPRERSSCPSPMSSPCTRPARTPRTRVASTTYYTQRLYIPELKNDIGGKKKSIRISDSRIDFSLIFYFKNFFDLSSFFYFYLFFFILFF